MEGACCQRETNRCMVVWGSRTPRGKGRGVLRAGTICTAIMSPNSGPLYPARCPSVGLPGDRIMVEGRRRV